MHAWILTDGKIGTVNQCRGLAERLDISVEERVVRPRLPWRLLPAALWPLPLLADRATLCPPWPGLVIAGGRSAMAPAAALRRRGALVIAILDPRLPPSRFDLVVAPRHDALDGPNVLVTDGAMNRVTPAALAEAGRHFAPLLGGLPRPLAAVLVGGSSARYRMDGAAAETLAGRLTALADAGTGLAITLSRRTPPAARALLTDRLAGRPGVFLWDGTGDNPYLGMLALADHLLVTIDSVSMLSEAATTGKPVHAIALPGTPGKFARFHARLAELGAMRPFDGTLPTWSYTPLDDAGAAATAVRRLLART